MPIELLSPTMKKLIIVLIFPFVSCVKEDCVDFEIANRTDNSLNIVCQEVNEPARNISIAPSSSFSELSICDWGGNEITYSVYDSIQIIVNNLTRKTYYPSSVGKNIYKTQDREFWKLVIQRSHYRKIVFEITEMDLQ